MSDLPWDDRFVLPAPSRPGTPVIERLTMHGLWTVRKFWADDDLRRATPYEVIEHENAMVTAGATAMWNRFVDQAAVPAFNGTNARLGVGDSSAAVAAGQTDLQAATNKLRKLVDAAPVISGATATFVATFTTAEANFAWLEAASFNAASGATMFNRVAQNFGTKTSSVQWVLTFAGTFVTA